MKSQRVAMVRNLEQGKDRLSGILGGIVDRRPDSWYDVQRFRAGDELAGSCPMFVEPVSPKKPYLDTNMLLGSMFPAPFDSILNHILFVFTPGPEVERFVRRTWFSFEVLEKRWRKGPLAELASYGAAAGVIESAKGDLLGLQHVCPRFASPVETYIPPLLQFRFCLWFDSPFVVENDIEMWAFLVGLVDHPVS